MELLSVNEVHEIHIEMTLIVLLTCRLSKWDDEICGAYSRTWDALKCNACCAGEFSDIGNYVLDNGTGLSS